MKKIALFLALALLCARCSNDEDAIVPLLGISIAEADTNLIEGDILQLIAEITLPNVIDDTIIWSSDNTVVATVDENGLVQALQPGIATITATLQADTRIFDSVEITVDKETPFVTTWENTRRVIIPMNSTFSYNYQVDWGDGTVEQVTNEDAEPLERDIIIFSHTFETEGPHTVSITGQFPAIELIAVSTNREKITAVNQWGTIAWESMEEAFFGCSNITFPATDVPDLTKVKNMARMFQSTLIANPDVSQWDVSNVTNMIAMFQSTPLANPDVSDWDVGNVERMAYMFLTAKSANPDVSRWNVSKVTNMQSMFHSAPIANPDVSDWDVSNVEYMSYMFSGAISAAPDVSDWKVNSVIYMQGIFRDATSAKPNVSQWEVDNVINIEKMFEGATSANPDVSQWKVDKVTNMEKMFEGAISANPDMSNWDIPNVTTMEDMLSGSALSPENYTAALVNFANQPTQNDVPLGANGVQFCTEQGAEAAKATLSSRDWTITDDGPTDCTVP